MERILKWIRECDAAWHGVFRSFVNIPAPHKNVRKIEMSTAIKNEHFDRAMTETCQGVLSKHIFYFLIALTLSKLTSSLLKTCV